TLNDTDTICFGPLPQFFVTHFRPGSDVHHSGQNARLEVVLAHDAVFVVDNLEQRRPAFRPHHERKWDRFALRTQPVSRPLRLRGSERAASGYADVLAVLVKYS